MSNMMNLRRPACEPMKQTEKGKQRSKLFSVNGPMFKPKVDKHQIQTRNSPLRKRLRVPLSLVIPCDSFTDDSVSSTMRRPNMQRLCVPENALNLVESVCSPVKRLVV